MDAFWLESILRSFLPPRLEFASKYQVEEGMTDKIRGLYDSQSEITMQARCMGFTKIDHILRAEVGTGQPRARERRQTARGSAKQRHRAPNSRRTAQTDESSVRGYKFRRWGKSHAAKEGLARI